jgi:hypothetical protein
MVDDTPISRRRESNMLAAPRFRSREKGYQVNLEERTRALEGDRDHFALLLDEYFTWTAKRADDPYVRYRSHAAARYSTSQFEYFLSSVLLERLKGFEINLRIAALKSANRRLREELERAYEENDRLQEELDKWRTMGTEVMDDARHHEDVSREESFLRSR